jgi:rRNA pseudouridine-1189 N-methylase Emg1 (Nep1/Mra1 family)
LCAFLIAYNGLGMVSAEIKNKTKLKEMDIKKLKLAIEQAQKVCNEMNKCANKFILQDSINEMNQALTIPVVVGTLCKCDGKIETTYDSEMNLVCKECYNQLLA